MYQAAVYAGSQRAWWRFKARRPGSAAAWAVDEKGMVKMGYSVRFGTASSGVEVSMDQIKLVRGPAGPPGSSPSIGENGNWWVDGTDTGVPAVVKVYKTHGELSGRDAPQQHPVEAITGLKAALAEIPALLARLEQHEATQNAHPNLVVDGNSEVEG